jgi:hypothetical protein
MLTAVCRIMGFAENHTNPPGMNISDKERKRLLGLSFSIPVVEYLLSPLLRLLEGDTVPTEKIGTLTQLVGKMKS